MWATVYIADWSIRAAAPLGLTHEETLWCVIQPLPRHPAKMRHQLFLSVENWLIRGPVSSTFVLRTARKRGEKINFLCCVLKFPKCCTTLEPNEEHEGSHLWSPLWTVAQLSCALVVKSLFAFPWKQENKLFLHFFGGGWEFNHVCRVQIPQISCHCPQSVSSSNYFSLLTEFIYSLQPSSPPCTFPRLSGGGIYYEENKSSH